MVLIEPLQNLELIKTYNDSWNFTREYLKKVKKEFRTELKDFKVNNKKKEADEVADYLNNMGFADQEIIEGVLSKEKKTYWVNYINESNGYFEIYELKKKRTTIDIDLKKFDYWLLLNSDIIHNLFKSSPFIKDEREIIIEIINKYLTNKEKKK